MGYNVPASGPCGEVLRLLGRHTWRAAHIHVKVSADGYMPLTTQLYIDEDAHLDSDTTFAVRTAILKLQKHESLAELQALHQSRTFYTYEFDFALTPIAIEHSTQNLPSLTATV
jgi:hydroxyquinol 1,2-dioxygenase